MEEPPPLLDNQVLVAFADPSRTLDDNGKRFEAWRDMCAKVMGPKDDAERIFNDSFALVTGLEELERDCADPTKASDASDEAATLFLNLEFRLYKLNESTPLRKNPFLSHWVDTYLDLNERVREARKPSGARTNEEYKISWAKTWTARLRMIRNILSGHNLDAIGRSIPLDLLADSGWSVRAFQIAPFVSILREDGIYDSPSSTADVPKNENEDDLLHDVLSESPASSPSEAAPRSSTSSSSSAVTATNPLLASLDVDPANALVTLSHLPIDLPSLDRLTMLLQSSDLAAYALDRVTVARHYLQHGLRQVENMHSTSARDEYSGPRSAFGDEGLSAQEDGYEVERGRDAQARAVRLLVLFVRNLIRKALVPPEELYFEIQEICVRFVWIKEVREFRAFLEVGGA